MQRARRLDGLQDGDDVARTHAQRVQAIDQMLQRKKEEMIALFTSNLVDQMEKNGRIKKNQPQIDALSKRTGGAGGF